MHCPETPDQIPGVDADDVAIGEEVCEDIERHTIIGIVEDRDENNSVGDVEVSIAGGQAAALEDHRTRHRQFDHTQWFAILIGSSTQATQVFF